MTVARLGAWCDYVTEAGPGGSSSFRVQEYAVLDDGTRIVLHDERGYTTGLGGSDQSGTADRWRFLTEAAVERGVRTTVLPDEDDGEEHPWAWLSGLLLAHGVIVTPEQLQAIPYEVELSERLRARVRPDQGPSSARDDLT